MTPAEINGRMRAHSAYLEQAAERDNTIAWLTGKYAAYAHHAPKKYPMKPWLLKEEQPKAMTETDMKDTMRAFMAKQREVSEVGDNA